MAADTASLSHTGGRKENQDACGFEQNESGACWVVADGLGGHAGGEIASRMAVDAVLSLFREKSSLPSVSAGDVIDCFDAAQAAIQNKADKEYSLSGMRTTMVVLLGKQDRLVWGHVGDSRLYLFRQGQIVQQTRDHSVPQMLVDAGKLKPEELRGHEDQNRLTRALGQEGTIRPAVLSEPVVLQNGDAALLCSDGIWTWILEQEMEEDLHKAQSAGEWLELLEKRLLARVTGQYDNYTAIAVLFSGKRSSQT